MQSYIVYIIDNDVYRTLCTLLSKACSYIIYDGSFEGTIYEQDNEYYLLVPIEVNL